MSAQSILSFTNITANTTQSFMRVQHEHKSRFLAAINQYNFSKVYGATHILSRLKSALKVEHGQIKICPFLIQLP